MKKSQFFRQGLVLTAVSFFMRVTNIAYRAYLARAIGTQGLGLYQLIFTVFTLSVTLSTSGISLAVTRIVADRMARRQPQTVRSAVARCLGYCLCISLSIGAVFLLLAPVLAKTLLGTAAAAPSLRLLALGLPFMSLCTCMRGYFLAVDESLATVGGELLEQLLTMGLGAGLLSVFTPATPAAACTLVMAASSAGEAAGFLFTWVRFRRSLCRHTPPVGEKSPGILKSMLHIALPGTLSSAARNLLGTAENLMIPRGLRQYGASYEAALAAYGVLQGMALPLLLFPSAFLTAFSSLLIPQVAKAHAAGKTAYIHSVAHRALGATAVFAGTATAYFLLFGEELGQLFYNSPEAGAYLRLLAPLVLLMYLDGVVDAVLKGMDEQFSAFKYNVTDAALRVLLVAVLLPRYGLPAYICILFFSTIFNANLSIHRLLQVTHLQIDLIRDLALPFLCAGAAALAAGLLSFGMAQGAGRLLVQTILYLGLDLLLLRLILPQAAPKRPNGKPDRV